MNSAKARNQEGASWVVKAILYTLSAIGAGLAVGAIASWILQFASFEARIGIATLLTLVAILLGILELCGKPPPLLQLDCETSQRWMNYGPILWALFNGTALGVGFASRIGFWLWYLIPIGLLCVSNPFQGALIVAAYSAARVLPVWFWLICARKADWNSLSLRLVRAYKAVRRMTVLITSILAIWIIRIIG